MKNKNIKLCVVLTLLFLAIPAGVLAGDYAELDFIGISENGKYSAFEEYGTQDGSGFPYSNYNFFPKFRV